MARFIMVEPAGIAETTVLSQRLEMTRAYVSRLPSEFASTKAQDAKHRPLLPSVARVAWCQRAKFGVNAAVVAQLR